MPLTPAKCPHCGAAIQVNPNAKQLLCRYCGNEFIVEEAIKNVNVTIKDSQINNDFSGATIYVQNGTAENKGPALTRNLYLKFGRTMVTGGSWEFFVDGKSACTLSGGEWSIKISEEEHTLQAKLIGGGMVQVTNILKVEPGNTDYTIIIRNRVFASPLIEFKFYKDESGFSRQR